jgi:hypothetical protein
VNRLDRSDLDSEPYLERVDAASPALGGTRSPRRLIEKILETVVDFLNPEVLTLEMLFPVTSSIT